MHISSNEIKWKLAIAVKNFDRKTNFFLTIFKKTKKNCVNTHKNTH